MEMEVSYGLMGQFHETGRGNKLNVFGINVVGSDHVNITTS
jgi:hypothetical protein